MVMVKVTLSHAYMPNALIDLVGTIRTQSTCETVKFLRGKLGSLGVTRVAEITSLDTVGIPAHVAIRPLGKHLSSSQGKGVTPELSWISAVMEAAEGYHIENAKPAIIHDSYNALSKSHECVDPTKFAHTLLNKRNLLDIDLGWVKAQEIYSNHSYLIPHAITSMDSTGYQPEKNFLSISSNGLAAGNCHDEATCHALLEINERDDLTQWSRSKIPLAQHPQINLSTIGGSSQQLISTIDNANLKLQLWDISQSSLYTFRCTINEIETNRRLSTAFGTGCHYNRDIAISRAITEAVQDRLVLISGSRDDIFPDFYHKLNAQDAVKFSGAYISLKNRVNQQSMDTVQALLDQIKVILREEKSISEIFYYDHTKSDIGIPVVQLFIPKMQYSHRRM